MKFQDVEDFKKYVRKERAKLLSPYDAVYNAFVDFGFHKKDKDYFKNNASTIVQDLRNKCWSDYTKLEESFSTSLLKELVSEDEVDSLKPIEAINYLIDNRSEYLYQFSLSTTNSRRSRAGKEFEAIIELICIGAGIPFESQGALGSNAFKKADLGKLVDFVIPGSVQFMINKQKTTLISAKTSLRERWQEVPEEIKRTSSVSMYLATLDKNISTDTLQILYDNNIVLVTTEDIKQNNYSDSRVISFEEMLKESVFQVNYWDNYQYKPEELETIQKNIEKQIEKHKSHPFVKQFYTEMIIGSEDK